MEKKTKKTKREGWVKIMDLIEKEISLFDKRPKKERRIHPSGPCYVDPIMNEIRKICDFNSNKALKYMAEMVSDEFEGRQVTAPKGILKTAIKRTKIDLKIYGK